MNSGESLEKDAALSTLSAKNIKYNSSPFMVYLRYYKGIWTKKGLF